MSHATDIKLIHIGKSALGLDDDTYRAMLAALCNGKTSSTKLTATERQVVLQHMKRRGFTVKTKAGKPTSSDRADPMVRKLMAMWYALAEAGAVAQPSNSEACYAAVDAWAQRQLSARAVPLQALRFASGDDLAKLIEEMKAWGRRVRADIS